MRRPETPKAALQELDRSPKTGTGLLVLMPTRGSVSVETFTALSSNCDGLPKAIVTVARRPVVEARNSLWKIATEAQAQLPWSEAFVLHVDDDAFWLPGTISKMIDTLRTYPQIDVLSGAYCTRLPFYTMIGNRTAGKLSPPVPKQVGEICEVQEVGMHFVMHRIKLLSKVGPDPFNRIENMPEDYSWSRHVREAGGRLFIATGANVAHVDANSGSAYLVGSAVHKIENNELRPVQSEHLGLRLAEERVY